MFQFKATFPLIFLVLACFCHCKPVIPRYTVDRVCAVGENFISAKKTFELWTGKTIPDNFIIGDAKLFTGFKVHRVFSFRHLFRNDGKTIKISFCDNGKVAFESEKVIGSVHDWSMPWCFFEAEFGSNDLSRFHCLKMARRKEYALRPFDLFIPYSWVGGLFYCDIEDKDKRLIISGFSNETNNFDYANICTLKNAYPIQPLFAAGYKDSWTESTARKIIPMISLLSKRNSKRYIPFLQTPSLNLKASNDSFNSLYFNISLSLNTMVSTGFKLPKYYELLKWFKSRKKTDQSLWFEEIEVSENYNYDSQDKFVLNTAERKLKDILSPLIQDTDKVMEFWGFSFKSLGKSKHIRHLVEQTFGITDKLPALNITSVFDKSSSFLTYWENLRVSKEAFTYTKHQKQIQ